MNTLRPVTDDDIQAATNGLRMMKLTNDELAELVRRHLPKPITASQVIAAAAQRVLDMRSPVL